MKKEYIYIGLGVAAVAAWYWWNQNKAATAATASNSSTSSTTGTIASNTIASSTVSSSAPTSYPSGLVENELVKIDSDPTVYQLIGYKACPVTLAYWANKMNYAPVTTITPAQLSAMPIGSVLDYTSSATGSYHGSLNNFYSK